MNRSIMQWKHIFLAVLSSALVAGCAPGGITEPGQVQISRVEQILAEGDEYRALEDEPAARHFKQLSRIFADKRQQELQFNIYALAAAPSEPQAYLKQRATQLGMKAYRPLYPDDNLDPGLSTAQARAARVIGLRDVEYELALNLDNGSELFVDRERFHNGIGVAEEKLKPQAFYLKQAKAHIDSRVLPRLEKSRLYPYKQRIYLDALAKEGNKPAITASQIAVAYNTAVDGLAVIGPGAKAVVHMSPEGRVVSHESTLRPLGRRIARIGGKDLLDPRTARSMSERQLLEKGIKPDSYTLSRSEFGYFRLGRNGIQEILAPYYAFVYEPKSEAIVGRRVFEIIAAVREPKLAALIDEDRQRDEQRKRRYIDAAGEPDTRRNP